MKKIIEKKTLRKDKRAVSPVIAEILMVGIVVILAAVIATFVFMIGAPERALQANLYIVSADNSDAKVVIRHQGGDKIVFRETVCVWTPDVGTPSTTENGGTLVMDAGATELGSATVFEPGEFANLQNAVTLTVENTAKLVIIHVPSGKQIFSRTVTVVA
ncbi:MAG: type IV pilin N-terminal domain-containing protein [Methanophagales archaeon]|nr:type IV pilin N-terminal domain-containing protein [Methanophagales archaeon]